MPPEANNNLHIVVKPYDAPQFRQRFIAELAARYTSAQGGCVLDVGCGFGHTLKIVEELRPDLALYAADGYQDALDATGSAVTLRGQFKLSQAALNIGEVTDVKFDTIIMSHILEHLYYPIGAIQEGLKQLNAGGFLILAVPNTAQPRSVLQHLLKRNRVNKGHVYSWDAAHWRNFLDNIMELDVVEYTTDQVDLFPGALRLPIARTISRWAAKAAPWWGVSNVAVVKK